MNDSDRINELKKKRFQFLHSLYKRSGGGWSTGPDTREFFSGYEIGESLSFHEQLTENVIRYLEDEGLIKSVSAQGDISITHQGILEIEEVLSNPSEPTEHFLPFNIILGSTIINSQIQQGSPGATQMVVISVEEKQQLEEIIKSLKEQTTEFGLDEENKVDLETQIKTIETQISSPKPRKPIIIESLKAILASAAGSLLASGLLQQITAWIGG